MFQFALESRLSCHSPRWSRFSPHFKGRRPAVFLFPLCVVYKIEGYSYAGETLAQNPFWLLCLPSFCSIIMTISSTLLALVLMPLCLWIYSRAWINTPLVQLLPLGAVTLTVCSTLIPIGLGVFIRYKYNRVADYIVKVRSLFPFHTR